jgi:putative DNA primase/helicase
MENAMPTAASIIRGLDGNSANGMCRCPAHDDGKASLHISEGANGKVLVHCHAGCTFEAITAALRPRGLWGKGEPAAVAQRKPAPEPEKDTFYKAMAILRAAAKSKDRPTAYLRNRGIAIVPDCAMLLPAKETARLVGPRFPAMVVPITNAGGLLQGCQVTILIKDATAKATGANGDIKRTYGTITGGFVRLGKIDPDATLIIGEGVESTLAAMQLTGFGGIATLGTANMKTVEPPPCSEIIIAADNDAPGREAATALAQRLAVPGRKVRVAIPDGEGCDWNDELRSGKNLDALRNAILRARPTLAQAKPGGVVLTVKEFLMIEVPEQTFFLRPWLAAGSLGMIHAARGAGKTWVALSAAYAVASGQPLLGWPVERRAKVLYVDAELPVGLVQRRLRKFGSEPPDLSILSMELVYRNGGIPPDLATAPGQEFFDRVFDEHKPELIFLDPLTALIRSGAENEAESWAPVQAWLLKQRFRGRTIFLVHHEGKSGKQRGTSKRENVLDVVLGLKERQDLVDGKESAFELNFNKNRDFYGDDVKSQILHLSTESGKVEWRREPMEASKQERATEMLAKGEPTTAIMEATDLSKGRVSQLRKKMREAGGLIANP